MTSVSDPRTSYDFSGLGALKAQAARDRTDDEAITKTAKQFEAMFLQMMLKSMREAVPKGGLFDSDETETFEQMLDQQFALAMAERGSTGLSQMVEDFIRRSQGPASAGNSPEKFLLDREARDPLPLVNESTKFKISEGTTQNFLLNRTRYAIGRND